nr:DUF1134 domain-containing protein [Sphingobium boeckii]
MIRGLLFAGLLAVGMVPLSAQIQPVDPNDSIDADLAPQGGYSEVPQTPPAATDRAVTVSPVTPTIAATPPAPGASDTFQKGDLIGAAEGVFGKGAAGLAGVIEDILAKQGEPNAYITGQEAGGAFVVGLRYGSGILHHKVEGERKAYWTGPSVGFDVGGNAAKTFVLVYNLYDSEELYKRFPAGEGAAYFVGGFNVSYLRWKDVVLIPVRLGAGVRLGANVGYMKFSKKGNWVPF